MLKSKPINAQTAQDEKIIDKNDFWLIPNNPITKIGVFPYLGRQISPELEPDRIYQVLRPEEELTRAETLRSMEQVPIINDHTMLGTGPGMKPAEEVGIHGVTGTNVKRDGDFITNDLKLFSETLKELIESGKKELSMGYRCRYELTSGEFRGQDYDAVQRDIYLNHIALVDEGRCGSEVRVMDCSMAFDSLTEIIKHKENEMKQKGQKKKFAMDADVDKRELIREVMAIAAKPNDDFEGGEEEKIETIAKKLEAMSYNDSERGGEDEDPKKPCEDEDIDKRQKIEDVGKYLREKGLSNEDIQYVLKEMFEDAYNDSEAGGEDEQPDPKKDDKDKKEGLSMDEAVKYLAHRDGLINQLKPVIGENARFTSMTTEQITKYACDKLDLKPAKGNELSMLEGYLKAMAKAQKLVTVGADSALKQQCGESAVITSYKEEK